MNKNNLIELRSNLDIAYRSIAGAGHGMRALGMGDSGNDLIKSAEVVRCAHELVRDMVIELDVNRGESEDQRYLTCFVGDGIERAVVVLANSVENARVNGAKQCGLSKSAARNMDVHKVADFFDGYLVR